MKAHWLFPSVFWCVGCSYLSTGATPIDATTDGPTIESGASDGNIDASDGGMTVRDGAADAAGIGDSGADRAINDAADAAGDADGATKNGDASIVDAASDVIAADGACKCQPYWCGCGTCDPSQIACTVDPPVCARGCLSSCPQLQQVTCACDQGRCVRSGVDASTIGCVQDQDCPVGDCCAHSSAKTFCVPAPHQCCIGSGGPCP